MKRKPRALDLFCGAGGATCGLQYAGFHVTGVDINPQPRYCGDEFHQADAITFPLDGFDFIWASPPCQGYSIASSCRPGLNKTYPKLIGEIRERMRGRRYCIENVRGAKSHLRGPIMLCGSMFGLELYRHRYFEMSSEIVVEQPDHPKHHVKCSRAGHWVPGTYMSIAGAVSPIAKAREIMEVDWMSRSELVESIPPVFSEYIGLWVI